ncbi:MAG TPA: hypothetical protein VFV87_03000, partial [Pirellulaceae bacterium]|nr:hypothetical protein [Pirellulaceae bacterium]
AGVLYLVAGLMQLGLFSAAAPLVHSIAASTITLLAHLGIASAVMLYARHVVLDAQGRLKVHIDPDRRKGKKPKSRAKLKVVKADKSDDDSTVSAPASTKTAPAASEPAKPAAQPRFGWGGGGAANAPAKASAAVSKSSAPYDADDDEEDENEMDGQKLSRAERKRLKKLARRDQRRAA